MFRIAHFSISVSGVIPDFAQLDVEHATYPSASSGRDEDRTPTDPAGTIIVLAGIALPQNKIEYLLNITNCPCKDNDCPCGDSHPLMQQPGSAANCPARFAVGPASIYTASRQGAGLCGPDDKARCSGVRSLAFCCSLFNLNLNLLLHTDQKHLRHSPGV